MLRELADGSVFPYRLLHSTIAQFSESRDEQGHTGRDVFFGSLSDSLLPAEKVALDAWDQGNYDIDVVLPIRVP